MRNHTANSSVTPNILPPALTANTTRPTLSPEPVSLELSPSAFRTRRPSSSVLLLGSLACFAGLIGGATAAPSAAAEANALPQAAYSAKIVDTASLTPGATLSSVAPVVSMLPVPSTKPDPATASAKPVTKKKVKKAVTTTTAAPVLGEVAMALPTATTATTAPAAKAKTAKVPDTKAPVLAKEAPANTDLDAAFAALRKCESGGNYKIATGNGYYGAYQFDPRTWRSLGYSGLPSDAAPEVQDEAARKLLAKAGWGQWPACSRKLGLR